MNLIHFLLLTGAIGVICFVGSIIYFRHQEGK